MDYFQQHVAYDIEVTLDDKPLNVDNGSIVGRIQIQLNVSSFNFRNLF